MNHLFRGKALSVAQPWASAIVFAGKAIENLSWRTHYRGPIAIHASGSLRKDQIDEPQRQERGGPKRPLIDWILKGQRPFKLAPEHQGVIQSHILGIAMIVDCVERSSSPWFCGEYGWVLEGIVPIKPVPMTGSLGLWDCKLHYVPLVRR